MSRSRDECGVDRPVCASTAQRHGHRVSHSFGTVHQLSGLTPKAYATRRSALVVANWPRKDPPTLVIYLFPIRYKHVNLCTAVLFFASNPVPPCIEQGVGC